MLALSLLMQLQLEREWQKWQNLTRLLVALQQQYDASIAERAQRAASTEESDEDQEEDNSESITQFQRESRKPMRLRWGRSTGKAPADQKVS